MNERATWNEYGSSTCSKIPFELKKWYEETKKKKLSFYSLLFDRFPFSSPILDLYFGWYMLICTNSYTNSCTQKNSKWEQEIVKKIPRLWIWHQLVLGFLLADWLASWLAVSAWRSCHNHNLLKFWQGSIVDSFLLFRIKLLCFFSLNVNIKFMKEKKLVTLLLHLKCKLCGEERFYLHHLHHFTTTTNITRKT